MGVFIEATSLENNGFGRPSSDVLCFCALSNCRIRVLSSVYYVPPTTLISLSRQSLMLVILNPFSTQPFSNPYILSQPSHFFLHSLSGDCQRFFLLVVYGYILKLGSTLVSNGAELLLLVPSVSGLVGSVLLPVLGAVPDGAIVLFSGLGNDAQKQLSVGVGTLAGSTVMLTTIPWAMR